MTFEIRVRSAASLAAVVLAAALAGCAGPAPLPQAPPAPPPVALSSRLIEQAVGYRAYMARTKVISPAFADGGAIAQSLTTGAAYDPPMLVRGAIAYGAVVALQDPSFVAGVRAFAVDPAQRQNVTYAILRDPAYAVGFPGAGSAAGAVIAALGEDGRQLYDQGKLVKQAAYDVQAQAWSKTEVPNRVGRLQQAKTLSAAPMTGDVTETARLQQAILGGAPAMSTAAPPAPAPPPYTPLVIRSLAVAALAALGQAGDPYVDNVSGILVEPNAGTCLNLAKLNLYQCLAVSKPHYEDIFCLGQHIMMDTGRCIMKTSGAVMPLEIKPPPLDVTYTAKPYKSGPPKTPKKKG
ncbi:hypothetical protein [Phenylobacterium sp.]|jgi:hypothetical protein|uniref:hypothetical protein n=1 Tax=Phenylobacterium sp. TaxID=1871053 RepID=UPI002F41E70A